MLGSMSHRTATNVSHDELLQISQPRSVPPFETQQIVPTQKKDGPTLIVQPENCPELVHQVTTMCQNTSNRSLHRHIRGTLVRILGREEVRKKQNGND